MNIKEHVEELLKLWQPLAMVFIAHLLTAIPFIIMAVTILVLSGVPVT